MLLSGCATVQPSPGANRSIWLQAAAKNAVVHQEIMAFARGYDTVVGERGVTLSGGQKQRVSIARALLKDAPVLILDDCLSAVDAATEKAILSHFNTALQQKTTILITHRIFSLLAFDRIVVMEGGQIAEQGTHNELMLLNGLYAEMYNRQNEQALEGENFI